jgi:primosomal protein N' (replication factor Y)
VAIARIALPVAANTLFDYWVPDGLAARSGSVVRVRLGPRTMIGVVAEIVQDSEVASEKLHAVTEVVTAWPALPDDILALARFVSSYYQEPLGQVFAQFLPPASAAAHVGRRREEVDGPLRLTATGRAELPLRVARSRHARALLARWESMPDGLMTAEAVAALPVAERAAVRRWLAEGWAEPVARRPGGARGFPLNPDQQQAVDAITADLGGFRPHLLQGVTGSGKTEVYLAAAAAAMAAGRQVLLLVPEINLTPQLEHRVAAALPGWRIATLHSALPTGLRRDHWLAAASGAADIVVGTRLAVFAPLPRLGLVIVDEEHDPSYKQQDNLRYHSRDVAVWRARQRGVPVVLGSATPSLESLLHAQRGRYGWLRLPQRAVAAARLPSLRLAPDRGEAMREGMGAPLLDAIDLRLARGEQSLVFINRRGYSPSLLCSACGWQAGCRRCSARLVVHRDAGELRCHHCGHAERVPRGCPECGNVDLLPLGHGTQRLEQALGQRFPSARIARIDRDSTRRKGSFAAIRDEVHAGGLDILVGTQMLAKGHDFPRLTLVGVLGADNALYSADFRATERLAALMFQVAGRAGRADLPGEVIVQTNFPRHALYEALVRHDYDGLAAALLAERRVAGLPPYAHLALLGAEAVDRARVDAFLSAAYASGTAIQRESGLAVDVFPPVPAALSRRAGQERGQILVRSDERAALQQFLPRWRAAIEALPGRRVRWALDVDPLGFT